MKKLTWAYVVLLILGAIIGAFFLLQRPRYVVTLPGAAGYDSIGAYEQRSSDLAAGLDSLKAVLARKGTLDQDSVRLRISEVEQQLSALNAALRIWRDAHDQYGVGQAYRECVLLYGRVHSACQALSYDTLPPKSDTIHLAIP